IDTRAFPLFSDVWRARRKSLGHCGQTPRRDEGLYFVELKPCLAKRVAEQPREVFSRTRLHARGDLFGEQLKQKLSHARCRRPRSGATQRSTPWRARARAKYKPASR